jgi:H2-forming N5,N10-methylenetetrahydromethanopterin dehydrogenase-like enzyme
MGPIKKEVNTMNVIKSVIKDLYNVTGNLLSVAGTLSTTVSSELVNASAGLNQVIIATPQVIRELVLTPVTATAAYIAEDTGVSYSKAEKELLAKLPTSASDAVKQGVIEASRLVAQLMKEDAA